MHKDQTLSDRVDLILREMKRIISSAFPVALIFLAVSISLAVSVDTGLIDEGWLFWTLILTIPLGYWMTKSFIQQSDLAPDGLQAGFIAYFGLALLSGIAIGFGLLFLIIPGLVLIVRWAPIYGYGLAGGEHVGEAFGSAWEATDDHFWPIAVASIIPVILIVIGGGINFTAGVAMGTGAVDQSTISLPVSLAANSATYLSTVASTALGLAVYSLLRDPVGEVSDVFE